jgi:hypothetical protein
MNEWKFPYDQTIVEIQTRIYAGATTCNTIGHIDFDSVPPFRVKKVTIQKVFLRDGESNPGLPRDRRGY